jgi:hypothetical protein
VDTLPHQQKESGNDPWPVHFEFMQKTDYQVVNNTFEQSAAAARIKVAQMSADPAYFNYRKSLRIQNHFVNVNHDRIPQDLTVRAK